jgi:hypothetical protein
MSSCPTNGLIPKDAAYSNLTVTEITALCNLAAKTISGGGDNSSSGGVVHVIDPLVGDGSITDPITLKDGTGSVIPQYLLWEDGTAWNVIELQSLERSDNIVTISNSNSPVNLSSLASLLTSTTASKLILSASSALNDQVIMAYDSGNRTMNIDAPDGNDLDGTVITASGESISLFAGNSGSTGGTSGGDILISGGQSTTLPGTVTIKGGDSTNTSTSTGDIVLLPGRTLSTYFATSVFIGDNGTSTVGHLGSGGTYSILDSKSVSGYTISGPSQLNTDMTGYISIQFTGGGGASQVADTGLLQVTFSRPFTQTPRAVMIFNKNAIAANAGIYATAITITEFEIALTNYWVTNAGNRAWKNSHDTLAPFAYNPGAGDVITSAWLLPVEFFFLVIM